MARPVKYPFSDRLVAAGDTCQVPVADRRGVVNVRNAAAQWARKRGAKISVRSAPIKGDLGGITEGYYVTVELISLATTAV